MGWGGEGLEWGDLRVLEERGGVGQRQRSEPLAAERVPPIRHPVRMHELRSAGFKRADHGYLRGNLVDIFAQFPILEQVRQQRMEAIHTHELFRKVEWRSEVVDPTVEIFGIGDVVAMHLAA